MEESKKPTDRTILKLEKMRDWHREQYERTLSEQHREHYSAAVEAIVRLRQLEEDVDAGKPDSRYSGKGWGAGRSATDYLTRMYKATQTRGGMPMEQLITEIIRLGWTTKSGDKLRANAKKGINQSLGAKKNPRGGVELTLVRLPDGNIDLRSLYSEEEIAAFPVVELPRGRR